MADVLFDRKCRVTIAAALDGDYKNINTRRIQFEDLRTQFRIEKDLEKHPNKGEISITNLAEGTRSALQGIGAKIILQAGYGDAISQIFIGDVRTVEHTREGADWVTKVQAGDGERGYLYGRANESFAAGTTVARIVGFAAKFMGLGVAPTASIGGQYANGYVLSGRCSKELDKLLKASGHDWSIQDGQLQIIPPLGVNMERLIVLNADSGLIGSPEYGSAFQSKHKPILKVKCLLAPTLKCGGRVKLESKNHKGIHRILKLKHTGDTAGGEWYSELECEAVPTR